MRRGLKTHFTIMFLHLIYSIIYLLKSLNTHSFSRQSLHKINVKYCYFISVIVVVSFSNFIDFLSGKHHRKASVSIINNVVFPRRVTKAMMSCQGDKCLSHICCLFCCLVENNFLLQKSTLTHAFFARRLCLPSMGLFSQ